MPFSSGVERIIFVVSYVLLFAVILLGISWLLASVFCFICRLIKPKHAPRFITLAWICWIPAAIITFYLTACYNKNKMNPTSVIINQYQTNAHDVYKKVNHSIYQIYSKDGKNNVLASGGAVAVSKSFLATNCHILENADHFTIQIDKKEQVGNIYSQHGDLCIIQVSNHEFIPIEIRNSKDVNIGEDVYAIGNPEGFEKTISRGIVSNKHDDEGMITLQTDAAISPGSSGGGLFDHDGKLIGITTIKLANESDEGLGFVIPTETIQAAILEPIKNEKMVSVQKNNQNEQAIQESNNQNDFPLITLIGTYGESKIALVQAGNLCLMAIQGRSKEGDSRSLAIWTPYRPKIFFIFPSTISPIEAGKILGAYFKRDDSLVLTQNYLFIDKISYQLSGEKNLEEDYYPILTVEINKNPIKLFIDADYFTAVFTDKNSSTGYSTDYYDLDGFSETLSEYHDHCD